jgi:hypothetical protein
VHKSCICPPRVGNFYIIMSAMNSRVSLVPPASLLQATHRILRPLVRLLISHGVAFPYFSSLAKAVFVDVAARDFPEQQGAISDSRVSLLSGVHRREVKRLRLETPDFTPPPTVSMGAELVARWCADPTYLDGARRPKPLARLAKAGREASFEGLVASVSKDIRSRAVLDEWLSLGVARLDEEGRVCLAESAFIPEQGFDEKAFYLGKGVHDHLAAASHNMLGLRPPFLDRMAYYDGLSPESVTELRDLSRNLAVHVLQEINRKALELQARDAAKEGMEGERARARVTFGTYFFATGGRGDEHV